MKTSDIIKKYVRISAENNEKRAEFNKSIAPLKEEIKAKEDAFKESIKPQTDMEKTYYESIMSEGQKILRKIIQLLETKHEKWNIAPESIEAFGIKLVTTESSWDYPIDIYGKLEYIENITDTHIKFRIYCDLQECDFAYGTIDIPIEYFDNDLLDNKEYTDKIFKQAEELINQRKNKEKQDKIESLKAKLAELEEDSEPER